MNFLLADLNGFVLATIAAGLLIVAPSFGVTQLIWRYVKTSDRLGLPGGFEMLLGITIFPILDALIAKSIGLEAVIVYRLLLGCIGFHSMFTAIKKLDRVVKIAVVTWWCLSAWAYIDIDYTERLNQSLIIIDLVKHAAVIQSIAEYGLPLRDTFFLRPEASGYYYYYYVAGAALDVIGGPLIESRMAFAAMAFSTGLCFPILLWSIASQAGWIKFGEEKRIAVIYVGLAFVSGLDLLGALGIYIKIGRIDGQLDWWQDEVTFAISSSLWVPHHLQAIMVSFVCAIMLCLAAEAKGRSKAILLGFVGMGFASVFGLSTWVALGAGVVFLSWCLINLAKPCGPLLTNLAIAGTIAILMSIPQFIELFSGRDLSQKPLAFWIKPVDEIDNLLTIAFAIPVAAALDILDLGFFFFGTLAFLHFKPITSWFNAPLARFLLISCVVGLILNATVKSTIINNDFGWRVIWFAQMPMMVWSGHALLKGLSRWPLPTVARTALVLGTAATLWSAIGLRLIRPPYFDTTWNYVNKQPELSYERRLAYEWANTNLPSQAVLQHNATQRFRMFDFGLYSHQRIGIADEQANLFGASKPELEQRLKQIDRIYSGIVSTEVLRETAQAMLIDYLMIDVNDNLWTQLNINNSKIPCTFRSKYVCIASVKEIK
ncbi:MAG: hypothetical protein ACRCY3_15950 [Sphingorhabdus sp.]